MTVVVASLQRVNVINTSLKITSIELLAHAPLVIYFVLFFFRRITFALPFNFSFSICDWAVVKYLTLHGGQQNSVWLSN